LPILNENGEFGYEVLVAASHCCWYEPTNKRVRQGIAAYR